ncbi:MAG: hypothetical protein OXI81_17515 [Paracoccaceae bacterium]|nr:hypothetical protein [Paracoccaceae bacterium]
MQQREPICVPAVSNANDRHEELVFADFVRNTTTANAEPGQTPQVALPHGPGTKDVRQAVDSGHYTILV